MPPSGETHYTFSHVLSIDPLVIFGLGNLGPFSPARQLCEPLKKFPTYFILGPSWDLDDPTELSLTVQRYFEHKLAYPQHNFIYMVNVEHHAENLRMYGVPAFFCHHNALIDERIYKIIPSEKHYDAIYNARLDPFKRHFLARKIKSLALIYYNMSGKEGLEYRDYVFKTLPQAVSLNDATGKYLYLPHDQICQHVNAAHTGLVLSEAEGGNHASVEYLLSGIPVVSTKNTGGRNHFLQPEFSRIVDPDPISVRDAVEELKSLCIPAETIRRKTLVRSLIHRRNLQEAVQRIFDHEGVRRNFADEWDTVYVNKLFNWGIPDWQVVDYVEKWRGCTDKVVEPLRRNRPLELEYERARAAA